MAWAPPLPHHPASRLPFGFPRLSLPLAPSLCVCEVQVLVTASASCGSVTLCPGRGRALSRVVWPLDPRQQKLNTSPRVLRAQRGWAFSALSAACRPSPPHVNPTYRHPPGNRLPGPATQAPRPWYLWLPSHFHPIHSHYCCVPEITVPV